MQIRRGFQSLLEAVYAPSCAACDAPIARGDGLCSACLESCEGVTGACPVCAGPNKTPNAPRCTRCRLRRPVLDSCTAVFEYGGQMAVALRRLKFHRRSDIARSLEPLLASEFGRAASRADLAIPIPLHRRRLAKRGFNQSQRLLVPLAKGLRLPVARQALCRRINTAPQAEMGAKERHANLRGAFEATEEVRGKRILLCDDVRTTGSTLDAAARALRRAGASEIHAFVVARADWDGPC